ncbi:hypothetical protein CC80DRAFT_203489 [Byssothecium circinans]|uniref:F-box domain-containing protein n=1 Tax=Byssothecium circinans TaxID=147558 RepID=A0A6A5TFF3_9PLEO|nr:hypothetical protein CC80DRAFT_203489 [Byssothecium circinans]
MSSGQTPQDGSGSGSASAAVAPVPKQQPAATTAMNASPFVVPGMQSNPVAISNTTAAPPQAATNPNSNVFPYGPPTSYPSAQTASNPFFAAMTGLNPFGPSALSNASNNTNPFASPGPSPTRPTFLISTPRGPAPARQKVWPHFGPGPASPTKPVSPKSPIAVRAPFATRKPQILASVNSRKVQAGRISKDSALTEAQKKRLSREGIVLGKSTAARVQPHANRLLNLPGELRNRIYHYCLVDTKQALLHHRPRVATLRSRTREDRTRPMAFADTASDDTKATSARESNRPSMALTQVCQQLRAEFFPLYYEKQEIGMDLKDVLKYIDTFIHTSMLTKEQFEGKDWPFKGNLTIALSDKISDDEKKGMEMWPLLEVWANSIQIQAGFGCYAARDALARPEGEAKDMYRLFGRKVLPDRTCSAMSRTWRMAMRYRMLESVVLHRDPPPKQLSTGWQPSNRPGTFVHTTVGGQIVNRDQGTVTTRPYIHLIYRYECAEDWMRFPDVGSTPPPNWLRERGFENMEFFEVKVSCGYPKDEEVMADQPEDLSAVGSLHPERD